MITVMVVTDGRQDCIERTLASFREKVAGPVTNTVIVNDSPDPAYDEWLVDAYGDDALITSNDGPERRGFCGAIQHGWSHIKMWLPDTGWIFHLEDDFTFNRPVDLWSFIEVLDAHPYLVQLALRRQPWNDEERRAGGIVEQWPGEYVEKFWIGHTWLEHRLFFTTNPSLYRIELTDRGWPDPPACERVFSDALLEDPNLRFGFWGSRDSGEWVNHIGLHRAGGGY